MVEYPDLSKLRVVDLKGLCSQYGLHTTGRKAELQERYNTKASSQVLRNMILDCKCTLRRTHSTKMTIRKVDLGRCRRPKNPK